LKKLQSANDNPRYAASRAGSVVGGLICGMHKADPADDIEEINHELVDGELEAAAEDGDPEQELEEGDEITFMGETESAFFEFLKQQHAGEKGQEDACTVATSAIEGTASIYSAKGS
jgi:hypothetical protein